MCKVEGCTAKHELHLCRSCKKIGSDHFRKNCKKKPVRHEEVDVRCRA